MYGSNKFLEQFILDQHKLVVSATDKKDKKGQIKSKHGTKTGKKELSDTNEFERLCQEKPPKKEVLDYFRDRIAELTAVEMAL